MPSHHQLVSTSHDLSAVCNLDSFLLCTLPTVHCLYMPKSSLGIASHCRRLLDTEEEVPFFTLGDLWNSFDEWSAYGAGVPITLPSGETLLQYYVPYLSALQIYENSTVCSEKRRLGDDSDLDFSSEASSDTEGDKSSRSDRHSKFSKAYAQWDESSDGVSSEESCQQQTQRGHLSFEFFERCAPYSRAPLSDKIAELATGFPKLRQWRSIELSSASWVSVAWYPIYCIPAGPTLRDMAACFLTFHSLSMPFQGGELCSNNYRDDASEASVPTRTEDNSCEIRESESKNPSAFSSLPSSSSSPTSSISSTTTKRTMDDSRSSTLSTTTKPTMDDDSREPILQVPKPCKVQGGSKIELPAFGLACYKLRGGLWNLERRRLTSLAHSADAWLKSYNVRHPDFDFFASRCGFLFKR